MICRINGTEKDIPVGISLTALLESKEIDPAGVVVEQNGTIVRRNRFSETEIKDGDRIEILSFVGGG
ncbi:MAG: sulfur carrier protein ThiS [Fibrobacterota bacterium]